MAQILPFIQIGLSVLLIAGILLQRSEAGLGTAFGSDSSFGTRFVRRGFEKWLFNATIVIAILFVISALLPLFLGR